MSILVNDNIDHIIQRGVSRYHAHLMRALGQEYGDALKIYRNPHLALYRQLQASYIRLPDIGAIRAARRNGLQVVYSAHYGYLPARAKYVVTVYDMILELFPNYFSPRYLTYRWEIEDKRRCIGRADMIIAISQSTASDVIKLYPEVSPEKIRVIHLGVEDGFFDADLIRAEPPYLLYVGHRGQYKNFRRLLTAFGSSGLARDFELHVLSPSGSGFTADEVAEMQRLHIADRVLLKVSASEEELRRSYAGAHVFVYPSEAEGFGLPILEAMASGTVVATSDRSSMPEIGGDAALYFDPRDVDSIAACLQHAAHLSDAERCARVDLGRARARAFSWERTRSQIAQAFRGVV